MGPGIHSRLLRKREEEEREGGQRRHGPAGELP